MSKQLVRGLFNGKTPTALKVDSDGALITAQGEIQNDNSTETPPPNGDSFTGQWFQNSDSHIAYSIYSDVRGQLIVETAKGPNGGRPINRRVLEVFPNETETGSFIKGPGVWARLIWTPETQGTVLNIWCGTGDALFPLVGPQDKEFWDEIKTHYGGIEVVERSPLIELKSIFGISGRRDVVTTAGSGTVTHAGAGVGSEFVLATTANGTDEAIFESAERGRYLPGAESEVGLGVRIPVTTLTGNQIARWGYFDADNGYFFGLDANGLFVGIRDNGTDTVIRRENFSLDKLDGTGPSQLSFDITEGIIYQIKFSWYGYGVVEFEVSIPDSHSAQRQYTLHRFHIGGKTSIKSPNQPIRAEIQNNGTAAASTMFVAGRQYAVLGRYDPSKRIAGSRREISLTAIGTTFLPVISFRRKVAYRDVNVKFEGFDLIASTNLFWQLRLDATLTGASFATPSDMAATETACEADSVATAVSGGLIMHPGGILGATTNQSVDTNSLGQFNIDIPALQPVTLCVRTITGTNQSVDGAVIRWDEEW